MNNRSFDMDLATAYFNVFFSKHSQHQMSTSWNSLDLDLLTFMSESQDYEKHEEEIEINGIKYKRSFMANFFNLRNSKLFKGKTQNCVHHNLDMSITARLKVLETIFDTFDIPDIAMRNFEQRKITAALTSPKKKISASAA